MPSLPTIDPQIAARLKLVRKSLGLSQAQMGALVKLDQSMIAYIENGKREAPIHIIKTLFIEKGISPTYVIAGGVSMEHRKTKANEATELADLRAEIEVLRGEFERLKQQLTLKQKED